MEGEELNSESRMTLFGRMTAKAVGLGAVAGLVALGMASPPVALAALLGCLAAGAYAAGYLRSHVFRSTSSVRFFDTRIASHFVVRLAVVALVGWLVLAWGEKESLRGYLLAFAAGFPILLFSELPRAARQLRARGLMG